MSDNELKLLQDQLKEAELQLVHTAGLCHTARRLMEETTSLIEDIRMKIQIYHLTHGR